MRTSQAPILQTVGACLLIVIAGCSLVPPEQPATQTVEVVVSNNHDVTYGFTVTVVPPTVEGLEVTYENGSTRSFDVDSIQGLPRTALRNATSITPLGTDARERRFDIEPGSARGTTIEDVPVNSTIAYFVTQRNGAGGLRSVGLTTCGEAAVRTTLEISIGRTGELHASTHCQA